MASLCARPLPRLALRSRISRKLIVSTQSAAPTNAILRRYTSSLSDFRCRPNVPHTRIPKIRQYFSPLVTTTYLPNRGYAELKASGGKTEADLIVEELQELYIFFLPENFQNE